MKKEMPMINLIPTRPVIILDNHQYNHATKENEIYEAKMIGEGEKENLYLVTGRGDEVWYKEEDIKQVNVERSLIGTEYKK